MADMLSAIWREYQQWAATSTMQKKRVMRAGILVLGLTLAGTLFGTIAPFIPEGLPVRALVPWIAAVSLGTATLITTQLLNASEQQAWVKTRALAEGLKSECYKFAMAAPPYDGPDAAALLEAKSTELEKSLGGVLADPVTDDTATKGLPSMGWTIADYVKGRVDDQVRFYREAIQKERTTIRQARWLATALGLVAVGLSVSGGGSTPGSTAAGTLAAALLGTVTTAAAAIGAAFQSGRHQQIALNYQTASNRLTRLISTSNASAMGALLVVQAEAIMLAEHAVWVAASQPIASTAQVSGVQAPRTGSTTAAKECGP